MRIKSKVIKASKEVKTAQTEGYFFTSSNLSFPMLKYFKHELPAMKKAISLVDIQNVSK